jgi:hypothetical protein
MADAWRLVLVAVFNGIGFHLFRGGNSFGHCIFAIGIDCGDGFVHLIIRTLFEHLRLFDHGIIAVSIAGGLITTTGHKQAY